MRFLRQVAGLVLGLMAASAGYAQASHCATLPALMNVRPGERTEIEAALYTSRGYECPGGFTLVAGGQCRKSNGAPLVERNPRGDCYGNLPLGPVKADAALERPAPGCMQPVIENRVALRGANAGWADIGLSAGEGAAVQIVPVKAGLGGTDPFAHDCSPHDCRMVKIITRAGTPAKLELTLSTPAGERATSLQMAVAPACRVQGR